VERNARAFMRALVIVLLLSLIGGPVVYAGPAVRVMYGEQEIPFTHGPDLVEGTTLIPLQDMAGLLGGHIYPSPDGKILRLAYENQSYLLFCSRTEARGPDGEILLSVAPYWQQNSLMVPVRFMAQVFGFDVLWHAELNVVELQGITIPEDFFRQYAEQVRQQQFIYNISDEELDLLLHLISAESPDEPLEGQVAVAAVVLNRVESPHFPNTVWDVIMQPRQFSPVWNGQIKRPIVPTAEEAAMRALRGVDPTNGALYFFNPRRTNDAFLWSLTPLVDIGDHRFAR